MSVIQHLQIVYYSNPTNTAYVVFVGNLLKNAEKVREVCRVY